MYILGKVIQILNNAKISVKKSDPTRKTVRPPGTQPKDQRYSEPAVPIEDGKYSSQKKILIARTVSVSLSTEYITIMQ
jgi:hypothetical protein